MLSRIIQMPAIATETTVDVLPVDETESRMQPHVVTAEIEGVGELTGIGTFSGPAGLADRMIESGELNRCVATMLYRFAIGRYEMGELDENFIDAVLERTGDGDFRFDELLVDFVASDMFRFRRVEEG